MLPDAKYFIPMVGGMLDSYFSNGDAVFIVSFMLANMLKFELSNIEGKETKASLFAAFGTSIRNRAGLNRESIQNRLNICALDIYLVI